MTKYLTVSYGDYIVALEQIQEAEVATRKYHSLILQEKTFSIFQEYAKTLFNFNELGNQKTCIY